MANRSESGRLGNLAASFAVLEAQLHVFVWHLIDPSDLEKGWEITRPLFFSKVREMALRLLDARSQVPDRDAIRGVLNEMQTLGEERNKFVHALWVPRGEEGDYQRATVHQVLKELAKGHGVTEQGLADALPEDERDRMQATTLAIQQAALKLASYTEALRQPIDE